MSGETAMKKDSCERHPKSRRVELEAFASHYGLNFLPDLLEAHLPGEDEVLRSPRLTPETEGLPVGEEILRSLRLTQDDRRLVSRGKLIHEVRLLSRFASMWPFREGFLRHVKDLI